MQTITELPQPMRLGTDDFKYCFETMRLAPRSQNRRAWFVYKSGPRVSKEFILCQLSMLPYPNETNAHTFNAYKLSSESIDIALS